MLKTVMFLLSAAVLTVALPAHAEDRVTLGWGRMLSNDALADGRDRWRTGGYQVSRVRGFSWNGHLPAAPGDILEFRASAQAIAPANLVTPMPFDRRDAAELSFAVHTQFDLRGNEVGLGAGLVFVGPQTGISNVQSWVHHMIGLPEPLVQASQIDNEIFPTLQAEVGRKFALGDQLMLRPFAAAEVGVESYVRVGGDLVIGTLGRDDLMVRDEVTGQRYRAVEGARDQGFSFVLGGDMARIFDSALLPAGDPATLTKDRSRLRAGVHWQGEKASAYYGVTYLGKEFDQQAEGQVVGSLNLNLRF